MTSINSTSQSARFIDVQDEPIESTYCIALIGADGKVIPNTRLSDDYDSPGAAFAVLDALKSKHPNAGVFAAAGVN